ncbi:RVT_3 domain-containing protein [Cephalotus follicularis]|uniref:RVT_3 domain-containing protein n=1 Tax=Cephalotus follicularis TaxID=3775 RepID=A0A1Q3CPJ0_CEPFO|nr:RVT_3 domain-containing protein [Cephalotus follicularis]
MQVLQKSDTSGRLVKWSVELGEYNIRYELRPAIKAQVLANFLIECTPVKVKIKDIKEDVPEQSFWVLYVDGSSSFNKSGTGLVLISLDGWTLQYALRFHLKVTNNEAEYEAVIKGLTLAKYLEVQRIRVFNDSQLVINQIKGEYKVRDEGMAKYLTKVRSLVFTFQYCYFFRIPRENNCRADVLLMVAVAKDIPQM